MKPILYFKFCLALNACQYAKLQTKQCPATIELLDFSHAIPRLEYREYNLEVVEDQFALQAFLEHWEWIDKEEFTQAYKRATGGEFDVYIDGKPI